MFADIGLKYPLVGAGARCTSAFDTLCRTAEETGTLRRYLAGFMSLHEHGEMGISVLDGVLRSDLERRDAAVAKGLYVLLANARAPVSNRASRTSVDEHAVIEVPELNLLLWRKTDDLGVLLEQAGWEATA